MFDNINIEKANKVNLKERPKNNNSESMISNLREQSCFGPLGMEHGHINDEDISASSAFDFKSVGPQNAR